MRKEKLAVGLITALLLAVLFLMTGCSRSKARTLKTESIYGEEGIRVTGTATVRAKPDVVVVRLGYENSSRRSKEVKTKSDEVMANVIKVITDLGVPKENIRTTEYNIYSYKDYSSGARNWYCSNEITVRVKDIEKVSDVIDAAMDAGANQVGRVDYTVEEYGALRAQAREKAVIAAKEKAEQLAKLTGVKLGKAVLINDTVIRSSNVPSYLVNKEGAYSPNASGYAAGGGQVPLPTEKPDSEITEGQIVVEASVNITYEIE